MDRYAWLIIATLIQMETFQYPITYCHHGNRDSQNLEATIANPSLIEWPHAHET